MWYVIQTLSGQEEGTADVIRKIICHDLVRECFVPKRERMKKFQGTWNKVEEVLFPGYAFVVSDRPEELYRELKKVPKLTKLLGREKDFFFSLSEKEERLVRGMGDRNHRTHLSQIELAEGKTIRVTSGPLKGYEGNIVKMNLHKREVTVKVEFMGRDVELKMGIRLPDMKSGPKCICRKNSGTVL